MDHGDIGKAAKEIAVKFLDNPEKYKNKVAHAIREGPPATIPPASTGRSASCANRAMLGDAPVPMPTAADPTPAPTASGTAAINLTDETPGVSPTAAAGSAAGSAVAAAAAAAAPSTDIGPSGTNLTGGTSVRIARI